MLNIEMPYINKNLENKKCLQDPGGGEVGQMLVKGNPTRWSTSLLRDDPAIFAPYLTANLTIPKNVITPLVTPNISLDAATTTPRAFEIFNVLGENVTNKKIFVLVTYSIVFAGNNQGERQFWIQTSASTTRSGMITQDGASDGNVLAGAVMLGLDIGESAAFYVFHDSNMDVDLQGGALTDARISKWQTALVN
jgi:hypothetical protein